MSVFSANFVVISPEFLGHEEFTSNGYWPGDVFIDEKKECYSTIGFKRYNPINGELDFQIF